MKIFLLGFMASGKTTIGKWAGRKGELDFIDLDQWIERKQGRSIPEIFREEGEIGFRKIEQKALISVIELEGDHLISCGGGTPCFFDNMERMNAAGMTLYLKLRPEILAGRLANAKTDRPLLVDGVALTNFVREKLAHREAFYAEAQVVLEGKKASKKDVWVEIEQWINHGDSE